MMDAFFKVITKTFGSRNDRELKKIWPLVTAINARESEFEKCTDAELREWTDRLRERLKKETLDDILVDAFALVREMSIRTPPPGAEKGLRHFDVQMVGGIVLHQGKIAEMATGEGKTLVATCPTYLNALSGEGVHVITVNDYLASRDCREWMGPIYERLGLTVGVIQSRRLGNAERHLGLRRRHHLRHEQRVRLRLPARQHEVALEDQVQRRATSRSSTRSTTSSSTRRVRR